MTAKRQSAEEKRDIFCREYIIDRNATRAAIAAGYSEKTAGSAGSRLLKDVRVVHRLLELTEERNKRCEVDADYVLKQAVAVHQRCMNDISPVTVGGKPVKDENDNVVFKFDSTGANKSLELIGKHVTVQAFKENMSINEDQTLTPWSQIEAGVDE